MSVKACKMATSIIMHRLMIQCTNTYLSLDAFNVNSGRNACMIRLQHYMMVTSTGDI